MPKRCHGDPRQIRVATLMCCFCGKEVQFHCDGAGELDVYSEKPSWAEDLKCSARGCGKKWVKVSYSDHKWPEAKWTNQLPSLRDWLEQQLEARERRRKSRRQKITDDSAKS